MTSLGSQHYDWGVESLRIEPFLRAFTGGADSQAEPQLNIFVIHTQEESTRDALKQAGVLARHLNARITLVAPHVVPYPLTLEHPPVPAAFLESRLKSMAGECAGVEAAIQIYLCRDRTEALASALEPGSIVILRGHKRKLRWWPTRDERLGARLRAQGCEVFTTRQ